MTEFSTDLRDSQSFPHFWEHTVGSGHALLALRADYQRQLRRAHDELGFKHVRFHGVLSDDMGTLTCQRDQLIESFFNADQIWDYLLEIGMKPFIELSFMPNALASGNDRVFKYQGNVTPPKDFAKWGQFIERYARHLVDRYGVDEVAQWSFEVWNEPNLPDFWKGTQAQYFHFYRETAEALKRVSPRLRVGGPATAKNEWIKEFVEFTRSQTVPVDFVSTHHYPTDALGKPGDDTAEDLSHVKRSLLREMAQKAHREARGLPLYYTEWSSSSNPFDEMHDQPYAAAFAAKTICEAHGLVDCYSWWTFTDIFEENYFSSKPFHGGFGLMTIHGIPKPSYRAFELLHRLGDRLHHVAGRHPTVDVFATSSANGTQVLLVNSQLPKHPIREESVHVKLKHGQPFRSASIERIDSKHANPRALWEKMESPCYLKKEDVARLENASKLVKEKLQITYAGEKVGEMSYDFEVTLEPQSVALVTLET